MRDDAGRPLFKQLREVDEAPLLKTLFRERAASAHADHPGKLIQGDRLAKRKPCRNEQGGFMNVFNLFDEQQWDSENDQPGYRHRTVAIGKRLGGRLLGGSLYELPPGQKTWPYHYELGCEEWLIAVSGRPTLRGPDGERKLAPGDVVVFPEGPAGGHQVINGSEEPSRVLIFSSKSPLAVVHYPDSGKVGLWSQAEGYQAMLKSEPKLDYWDGEI